MSHLFDSSVAGRYILAGISVRFNDGFVRETEHVVCGDDLDIDGDVGPP